MRIHKKIRRFARARFEPSQALPLIFDKGNRTRERDGNYSGRSGRAASINWPDRSDVWYRYISRAKRRIYLLMSPTQSLPSGGNQIMADFDIQIKGGTIVDGTRVPKYQGDVWIRDGKITQIG